MNERCQKKMDNLLGKCVDTAGNVLSSRANMMICRKIIRSACPLEFLQEGGVHHLLCRPLHMILSSHYLFFLSAPHPHRQPRYNIFHSPVRWSIAFEYRRPCILSNVWEIHAIWCKLIFEFDGIGATTPNYPTTITASWSTIYWASISLPAKSLPTISLPTNPSTHCKHRDWRTITKVHWTKCCNNH